MVVLASEVVGSIPAERTNYDVYNIAPSLP